MRRRNNPILTLLIVLFCLVLLALAGYMLVQVLPQKAPQEVTTIETNSVFESDGQTVEPDREQAYEGELPSGVDTTPEPEPDTPSAPDTPEAPSEDGLISADADKRARETLASMTEDEKIWQLFYVTPELLTGVETATRAGDSTKEALEAMPVGGIIYFAKNLEDRAQSVEMLSNTKSYAKIPLFLGTDEEGGTVSRVGANAAMDAVQTPSLQSLGEQADPAAVYQAGQDIAGSLHAIGFNMDFAPDADVNTNPDNPIIGTRAFSSDAATAAEMAAAAADGLRTGGILPTLKHFPGHGDTAEDSHTALAVTYKTLDELQACELLPFAADTGLHAVMVGHIAAPNVTGDDTPATLSPQLVALIPDAENTLIVTDSLAMDAITAAYTPGEAAVQALQAGCDVLLMPNSLPEAYAAVLEAVQNGTISEERLDRSVNKILLYKQQFAS